MIARLVWLFTFWLRKPLLWWVQLHVSPSGLPDSMGLDPKRPICYVLPTRSQSDRWILQAAAQNNGLARPGSRLRDLPGPGEAACLYLPALLEQRGQMHELLSQAISADDFDLQVIPVSVFWGRDPGKETSLLRILFSDAENPGFLRKLFIILANGRNTVLNFGKPIRFREFLDRAEQSKTDPRGVAQKLVRVLRIHYRRQRNETIGPSLSTRNQVVRAVLSDPDVRAAIDAEASSGEATVEKVRQRARECVEEIAADYSVATLRFLERVLTWVWNRVYDGVEVHRIDRAREAAARGGVVYLPSHRSHMDYLLLSYVLYHEGLVPPHIAAGINLNFWPVGRILRRGGAFFLRRSFGGDQVYTAVFRAYVDVLIGRGHPVSFYPEGGRSRTGRLLKPKTGMLAMVSASHLRNAEKPLTIIPVFIGYDQVMEVNAYFKELRGKRVKKESVFELLRARKMLRRKYGKAYLSFGKPIHMQSHVREHRPNWIEWHRGKDPEEQPAGFGDFVADLSDRIMIGINDAAVLTPTGLTGTALLATPQRALAEEELAERLDMWMELQRRCPYSPERILPSDSGMELLRRAEPIAALQRTMHPWGDLILADGRPGVLLTYARNNMLHTMALPSMLANYFRPGRTVSRKELIEAATELYPFVRNEFFVRWSIDEVGERMSQLCDEMRNLGLLRRSSGNRLSAPPVSTPEYAALAGLAGILRETMERYTMTAHLLLAHGRAGHVDKVAFVDQCRLMAERVAILSARDAPEFFDPALFNGFLSTLKAEGLLTPIPADELDERDERLRLEPAIADLAESSLQLLGQDIGQMILQLVQRSARQAEQGEDIAPQRTAG